MDKISFAKSIIRNLVFSTLVFFSALSVCASATLKSPGYAIASAHPLATDAGLQVLKEGGNAFDAAVTVSAVLAVVEPASSGIGGGGFWLLHDEKKQKDIFIDGRETAPKSAKPDQFLNAQGKPDARLSREGGLSVGIPGAPAAWVHMAKNYGRLPLSRLLQPAIVLAEQGFEVGERYRMLAGFRAHVMKRYPRTAKTFLVDGKLPDMGSILKQPELAETLRRLSAGGASGFYHGEVANAIIEAVNAHGGAWVAEDLTGYRVLEREPISFTYRDMSIVSAPLPSAGGIGLATILNILENYPLVQLRDAQQMHLVVEAMRRAYRDRAAYLGDPDFIQAPVELLLSKDYAAGLVASIHPEKATPSDWLPREAVEFSQGDNTSHFSVIDVHGNRVAATLSINFPFGSGITAAGVVLNNELDDFSAHPQSVNGYGLVGSLANRVQAGKRPLSSMSPTFVESENGVAVLGVPGGSRIITMVLLAILDLEKGHGPQSWVSIPRYHHQFYPDEISHEPGAIDAGVRDALLKMGYVFSDRGRRYGDMQALFWRTKGNVIEAASDPRGEGKAVFVPH